MFTYYVVVAMHGTHSEPVRHGVCVALPHSNCSRQPEWIYYGFPQPMEYSTMYDLVVAILGIAYPVMIIGFIVGAIVITFGGWHR